METINKNPSNFNQALWLGIGQLMTFAISFLSAAILARYFDKSEYGTYKQILYVYGTLQSLFTIGLPSVFAYFIPRLKAGQQKTLVNSLTRLFLILGFVFSITLYLLSAPIANLLKNPELAIGLQIFSPFPLFTLPTMGVEGIYTALKKTKAIALYQITSRMLMFFFIVLPVIVFNTGYKGAIIGWGVASFITFLIAFYLKNRPYVKIKKELVPNMYKTVFDYSLPLMGAFFAGFFISSADQFFISRYYGTEVFAEYSNGILSIPIVAMVSTSIKNVLLPLFSSAESKGNLKKALTSYNNAVIQSVILVYPIIVFALFFSKEIMIFIYGAQYSNSAIYMRYYLIQDFLQVFPYFAVLLGLGLSKIYLYIHVAGAIFIWLFDFLVVSTGLDAYFIVIVKSSFYLFLYLYVFSFISRKSHINLISWNIVKRTSIVLLHSFFCSFIIKLVSDNYLLNHNVLILLGISGILYTSVLLLTSKFFKINYFDSLKMIIKRKG